MQSRDERCIFLDKAGDCRVYAVRPVQCRTYPFWPELTESSKGWMTERRRCEGIGRGEPVSIQFIEKQIEIQKKADRIYDRERR